MHGWENFKGDICDEIASPLGRQVGKQWTLREEIHSLVVEDWKTCGDLRR